VIVDRARSRERADVGLDPIDERADAARALAPERRQPVFDVRRNDWKAAPFDEAVAFERAQRLREHLLGDAPDFGTQLGVALRSLEQRAQDQTAPSAEDVVEDVPPQAVLIVAVAA